MLIVYEREKITEAIGSQKAKIDFLQKFNKVAYFEKSFSQFFSAGVYQLEDGPPIVVLPWFLKKNNGLLDDEALHRSDLVFFEAIKEIKSFRDTAIDLSKGKSKFYALDIIVHSYLMNLKKTVSELLSYNYHEDVTDKINVIKGKWDTPKDISQGTRPVKFTCTYNSLEVNTPLFVFVKTFCRQLSMMLKSRKNLGLIDEILAMLKDVDFGHFSRRMTSDAHSWIKSHKESESLASIIDFAESLVLDQNIYSKDAGVSYQFQMDKFFEKLTFNFLKIKNDLVVLPQTRDDLLGGAFWRSIDEKLNNDHDVARARQYTIPDIVAFDDSRYLIFECKYKPLRIPFVNSNDSNQELSSFSRDDRNQLLSFIMSIRPSPELRNKKIEFIVIFPCSSTDTFKTSELYFDSAKLHVDPMVRNLIQNRLKVDSGLSIKFLGINISHMVETVLSKNISNVSEAISLSVQTGAQVLPLRQSNFEKIVQKRVALTSLIVDNAKNDVSMGRVKLAKVFYLADAHLKLGMDASYTREAAGPLDARLLYNDRWGIESQGERQAFYRRVESKKGNRYIPGINLASNVESAKKIFVDKIENIKWVLTLFEPLNTEQAEIVTTLYACWNDLLSKKAKISDEEIINDFHQNWHSSKLRFTRERLLNALDWMKENGLIPDGSGPISAPKQQIIPSGF
ncbi:hypothetical protein [Bdellovibrio bacteriovorus]